MRHMNTLYIILKALCLFDRIQVGALDILDQGGFKDLLVVEIDNVHGDFTDTGSLGGPQASFARNQLIAITDRTHNQRLQNAVGANAFRKRRKLVVVEHLSWLMRIMIDPSNGYSRLA